MKKQQIRFLSLVMALCMLCSTCVGCFAEPVAEEVALPIITPFASEIPVIEATALPTVTPATTEAGVDSPEESELPIPEFPPEASTSTDEVFVEEAADGNTTPMPTDAVLSEAPEDDNATPTPAQEESSSDDEPISMPETSIVPSEEMGEIEGLTDMETADELAIEMLSIEIEGNTYDDGDYNIDITSDFKMFVVSGATVTITGDAIEVAVVTTSASYDKIYIGSKDDAVKEPYYSRNDNGDGTYTFRFPLSADMLGKTINFVPGKPDGEWYTKADKTLTIPNVLEKVQDPEPDQPEPEIPAKEDGDYTTEVGSSSSMFKVASCVLTSNAGKMSAVITLSGKGYDKLYVGTADAAATAAESEFIAYAADANGQFTYTIPVSALDTEIAIAAHSIAKDLWYDRTLTFKSEGMVKVPETEEPACEDGDYTADVVSSSKMFKVVSCVLTSNAGKMTAVITLSGTGYDKLYVGTADAAATATESELIAYVADADGQYTFTIPVSALDTEIAIAAHSIAKDLWYDRTLTFLSETMKAVPEEEKPNPDEEIDDDGKETPAPEKDLSGSTSKVNSSTVLADGTYVPENFSYSGGTGKVSISCTKVTVKDGKATATIVFSSVNYVYVKANGNKYYGSHGGSSSTFEIPVKLNANNAIIGMTNKMSTEHEIAYTIYIYIAGADDSAEQAKDENAPELIGLTYESTDEILYAEYFDIYRYSNGFIVLDVVDAMPVLLVPADAEVPVGIENEMLIIQMPAENSYVASRDAFEFLDALEVMDRVKLTGIACEDCTIDSLSAAMDANEIQFAGTFDAPDYTMFLMQGCALAIMPNVVLEDAHVQIHEQLALLGVPMIVDRSLDEKSELASMEWVKLYGILFGCEEAAAQMFASAVEVAA